MMKICMQMCKFSLISSNILLAIVGFGMICLGTYFQFIAATIGLKITPFTTGVIALVITGILIMLVAVLGNHGACTHNTSVLNVLSGLLSLLIIINIAVGVMAFVRSGQMADDLAKFYIKIYTQNPDTRRNNETKVLELFHKAFDCCGTGGQPEELVRDTCPEVNYQKTFPSCPSVIQDMFNTNAPLVLGGFLGMAGIMMVALVCSVVLSRQLSQSPTPPPEYAAFWQDIHEKWIRDLLSLCRKNLS